ENVGFLVQQLRPWHGRVGALMQEVREHNLLGKLPAIVGYVFPWPPIAEVHPVRCAAQDELALARREKDVLSEQAARDRRRANEPADANPLGRPGELLLR